MIQMQDPIQTCIAKIIQNNFQVKNIFEEIYQQGGRVLLVGGAVRDCFLNIYDSDFDFEVYHLSFEQLQDILQKFGQVSFVGKSFGVLRLHGFNADWSIPRSDSFGRKPCVQLDPDMNFSQAFRRRDVTINAMGIDVSSYELIDPYNGLHDLHHNILRSPDVTFFVQDPLRLFRIMQLAARFDLSVDETLNQVCKTMDISALSSERIEQEFAKLFLKSFRPSIGLAWLAEIDRVNDIFPGVIFDEKLYNTIDCLAQGYNFSREQKLYILWGIIVHHLPQDDTKHVNVLSKISSAQMSSRTSFLKRYVGSIDLVSKASALSWYMHYIPELARMDDATAYKWFAYFLEPYFSLEIIGQVAYCVHDGQIADAFLQKAKAAKVLLKSEAPLLTGKDLLEYAQGKELGDLVKKAYELQLQENISDKQKLLTRLVK